MKRVIILLFCVTAAVSCENFFDRSPVNKFAATDFFKSENDLQMYTNGLINTALPSVSATTLGEDRWTDYCATKQSNTDGFFDREKYSAGVAGGWSYSSWSFLRRVAYMLDNMENARPNVSEAKFNHYEGVARFFRAFSTFNKVKDFGDCYFIEHVVSPSDSALLYAPRQSREYVMHKVVEDLSFAAENCLASGPGIHTDGRIYVNKYVALTLASRVCLYEGTYRKYHSANPSTGEPWSSEYESAEELLSLALNFSKQLIDLNAFSLNSDYRALFTSKKLPKNEVIWGRSYDEDLGVMHATTYSYCSSTSSQEYGPTKDYVRMFLKTDGTPAGGAISITREFEGRDKRLSAVVLSPDQKKTNASGASVAFTPNFSWTTTGYVWLKWVLAENGPLTSSTNNNYNSIPVMRYAEVLLNYAEAAAELDQMTEEIWNKTIGELRRRAGVTNIYPGSGSFVSDAILRDYFTRGLAHAGNPSDLLLEIRRERATELMLEGDSHYDDLMRWNLGDLISRRYDGKSWRGIYLTAEDVTNGFVFNGKRFTVSKTSPRSESNYLIKDTPESRVFTLSEGDHGYLMYNYEVWWDDKMYLKPIPTSAQNVNPKLGQNNGWQWQ